MTDQHTQPIRDPDHDQYAAGLYQAMALRFYARYVDRRIKAEFCGGDLEGYGPLPSQRDASNAYSKMAELWVGETPPTLDAVVALIEFAGVIAATHSPAR
jgi:hypothetical protein